jgi:hypothetical protein
MEGRNPLGCLPYGERAEAQKGRQRVSAGEASEGARSSVVERPPYTRKVSGSSPDAPTKAKLGRGVTASQLRLRNGEAPWRASRSPKRAPARQRWGGERGGGLAELANAPVLKTGGDSIPLQVRVLHPPQYV